MTLAKKQAGGLFFITAAIIYLAIYLVTRTPRAILHPALLSGAATFDLTVTVSLAFYFLLIRGRSGSWFTLIAVALVGLRSAAILLPAVDQPDLSFSKWMGVPLEVLLIVVIVRRIRLTSGDAVDRYAVRHQRLFLTNR